MEASERALLGVGARQDAALVALVAKNFPEVMRWSIRFEHVKQIVARLYTPAEIHFPTH